jgi:glycosyltransferase involved in cell wall biosynthesis
VSTPVGVEGLDLVPGEHVEVASDPAAFAAAVVALCRDPQRRERLADAALLRTAAYDWKRIGVVWRAVVESAA